MLLRNSSSLLRSTRLDSLLSLIGAGASLTEIELFPVSARKLPLPSVASNLLLSSCDATGIFRLCSAPTDFQLQRQRCLHGLPWPTPNPGTSPNIHALLHLDEPASDARARLLAAPTLA